MSIRDSLGLTETEECRVKVVMLLCDSNLVRWFLNPILRSWKTENSTDGWGVRFGFGEHLRQVWAGKAPCGAEWDDWDLIFIISVKGNLGGKTGKVPNERGKEGRRKALGGLGQSTLCDSSFASASSQSCHVMCSHVIVGSLWAPAASSPVLEPYSSPFFSKARAKAIAMWFKGKLLYMYCLKVLQCFMVYKTVTTGRFHS